MFSKNNAFDINEYESSCNKFTKYVTENKNGSWKIR